MVISDYNDCDYDHFDHTCWAIQLHVADAKIQDTEKFFRQHLGCHSRGVSVIDATHTVTISLLHAWVCFSLAFTTVFQAFLTTFLIDSGPKHQLKTWKISSPQVLNFHTHKITIKFSSSVTVQNYFK